MADARNPALKRTAIGFMDVVPTLTVTDGWRAQETIFVEALGAAIMPQPTPFAKRQLPPLSTPGSRAGLTSDGTDGNDGQDGSSGSLNSSVSLGSATSVQSQVTSGSSQSSITSNSQSQSQSQSDSQSQSSQSQSQSQFQSTSQTSQSQSQSSASQSSQSSQASISSDQSSSSSVQPSSSIPTTTPSSASSSTTSFPDNPSTSASSGITTTLFSTFVTDIDGHRATSVVAIPTVLPYPTPAPSSGSKRTIVTGSVIGGVAFVIIIAALIIFLRRSEKVRLNYKKLRVFGRDRRKMLEDEDDWLGGDAHGLSTTTRYRDYPTSISSSTRRFGGATERGAEVTPFDVQTPDTSLVAPNMAAPHSPYLLGMRASSSGSIFHEQVWPPPSEQSRLVDPLVAASSQVNLSNIVEDVMGRGPVRGYGMPPVAGASNSSAPAAYVAIGAPPPTRNPPPHVQRHVTNPSSEALFSGNSHKEHSRLPSYGTAVALGAGMDSPTYHQHPNQDDGSPGRRVVYPRPPSTLAEQWEMARAQSPDPDIYDPRSRTGTLAVRNAGPAPPMSPVSVNQRLPSSPATAQPTPEVQGPPHSLAR